MQSSVYKPIHLVWLGMVFAGISALWLLLGTTVSSRSTEVARKLAEQVSGNWGPPLVHTHPVAMISGTSDGEPHGSLLPEASDIHVALDFKPQQKGLLTHRTYAVSFDASYRWKNPQASDQWLEIGFTMPGRSTRVDQYEITVDGKVSDEAPVDGKVKASLLVPAGGTKVMTVKYSALGKDAWRYQLGEGGKARNFTLTMDTNFSEFNVPVDVESPTSRSAGTSGTTHTWVFPNVTGVEAVGLEVPKFVDTARVASRMSFFGPMSLGLFFVVLVIAGMRMGVCLHVMHFVLLAAACYAFQLLFSYTVDVMPALLAFAIAAAVSMGLVATYLKLVVGTAFMGVALAAQAAYIVLFNATFFFEGYTGLTLTIMGVMTLGLIMTGTAKMDWNAVLRRESPAA